MIPHISVTHFNLARCYRAALMRASGTPQAPVATVVQDLIQRGCDINIEYKGKTALAYACYTGTLESVKVLISLGADVNAGTRSPLAKLAMGQDRSRTLPDIGSITKMLTMKGADVLAPSKMPSTKTHAPTISVAIATNQVGVCRAMVSGLKEVAPNEDDAIWDTIYEEVKSVIQRSPSAKKFAAILGYEVVE
jgi:hypothetical protein